MDNALSTSSVLPDISLQDAIRSGVRLTVRNLLKNESLVPEVSDINLATHSCLEYCGYSRLDVVLDVCRAFATRSDPKIAKPQLDNLFYEINNDENLSESTRQLIASRIRTAIRLIPVSVTPRKEVLRPKNNHARPQLAGRPIAGSREDRIRQAFQRKPHV